MDTSYHSFPNRAQGGLRRDSRLFKAALLSFLFIGPSAAQPDDGGTGILDTIKERALDNLRVLPDYTCTSTIDRSSRRSLSRRFENFDRIRLEIAYVGGRELFGWPAGEQIAEQDLRKFVGGTVTNGDFALLTRALFAGPGVTFKQVSRKEADGHPVLSSDFVASREGSQWVLALDNQIVPVGYYGSFRADPDSLRLTGIAMTAEFIPQELGYRKITRSLEFQRARIGSDEFLLPSRAELVTLDKNGEEIRNETSFSNCRKYSAESVVRFETSETQPDRRGAQQVLGGLADDFKANCELESPVDSDVAAVGDPIVARLTKSISAKEVEIPKGALLHGRITRLNVVEGQRVADFGFRYFEWNGRRVNLTDRVNRLLLMTRHITGEQSSGAGPWSPKSATVETASTSLIRAYGRHLVVPRGFQFQMESKAKGL